MFATGKTTPLGSARQCGTGVCAGLSDLTLNRTFVAYESALTGDEFGRWRVAVRDLRSGRTTMRPPTGTPPQPTTGYLGVGPVTSLHVAPDGAVAWIVYDIFRSPSAKNEAEPSFYAVYVADRTGVRELTGGFDVDPGSLAIAGHTAYWTQGGKAASGSL